MGDFANASRATSQITVLAPVWGESYVCRFRDLVLPSWLAPGNLPDLIESDSPSLMILTRASDRPLLEDSRGLQRLASRMPVNFVEIDDLIGPGSTPVTLTLAYHRGMAVRLAESPSARFLLLNADFILSSGSLRTARKALEAGRPVLAPSLRAIEGELAGDLLRRVRDDVLDVSGRDLVKLALPAFHPTALCSRVDQSAFRSANPMQFYWRPSADVLLARSFCMFALGLELSGRPPAAEGYCDYSLVPLSVGEVEPVVLGDSDAFLALELAPLEQETEFFTMGPPTVAHLARKLSVWTTEFHRAQSRHLLVYKAAGVDHDLSKDDAASRAYVEEVLRHCGPALPQRRHPNWIGGLGAWRAARRYRGVEADPPELAPLDAQQAPRELTPSKAKVRAMARKVFFGRPGRRGLRHPYWTLEQQVAGWRRRHGDPPLRLVGDGGSLALTDTAEGTCSPADLGLVMLDLTSTEHARQLTVELSQAVGRRALVCAYTPLMTELDALTLAGLVGRLDGHWRVEALSSLDLRVDREVESRHGRLADLQGGGGGTLASVALRSAAAMLAMTAVNLKRAVLGRGPAAAPTVFLLDCIRREGPTSPTPGDASIGSATAACAELAAGSAQPRP